MKVTANIFFIVLLVIAFGFTSCVNTKKVTYFDNINDTALNVLDEGIDPIIQKGDVLSISVSSVTPEVAIVFNTPNSPSNTSMQNGNLNPAVGYLVNQDGYIQFPKLGRLLVAGLAKKDLEKEIENQLRDRKFLFDPIVNVRYLNFHITILGEVNNPGLVTIPNEQVTVLEAIGLAGDLTIYGKRENVLLIRKVANKRVVRRINLNSSNVLSSPYYYLKSNDVVYVEPNKNKVASVSQSRQVLPTIISGLSFLAIVIDRVFR